MLSLTDVLDLLTYELARLRRRRLAFALVTSGALQCLSFRHESPRGEMAVVEIHARTLPALTPSSWPLTPSPRLRLMLKRTHVSGFDILGARRCAMQVAEQAVTQVVDPAVH